MARTGGDFAGAGAGRAMRGLLVAAVMVCLALPIPAAAATYRIVPGVDSDGDTIPDSYVETDAMQ